MQEIERRHVGASTRRIHDGRELLQHQSLQRLIDFLGRGRVYF